MGRCSRTSCCAIGRDGRLSTSPLRPGTGELHKGHGIAFADLDNDGDEDIFEELGGSTPGDAHAARLFENPGHGADWINVRLVGVKTNRGAIGARIKVTVENEGLGKRSIDRTVGSGGSFGASPLQQHIGLGKSARIVDLEIQWPASGTRQRFQDLKKNRSLEIKERKRTFGRGRIGWEGVEGTDDEPSKPCSTTLRNWL